jgi:hypothetical protein
MVATYYSHCRACRFRRHKERARNFSPLFVPGCFAFAGQLSSAAFRGLEENLPTPNQRNASRSPNALSELWQKRTTLVKQELAAASAASDAKTAKLKALRLERERQEAEVAANNPEPAAAPRVVRAKRILVK